jgi:glycosyltransferase involved in cell wall biosynthesis
MGVMSVPREASDGASMRFSLVVATIGRTKPLNKLLRSLESQTQYLREIIIVDQNDSIDLCPILAASPLYPIIRHLHYPKLRGVSQARNIGWQQAVGDVLLFPDDDCWYPPDYFSKAAEILKESGAALLTGRATSESGRTINGRFEQFAAEIDRRLVFTTQIEWNMCIAASLMRSLGGYDETISLGGPTPWQGGEGYDLILRALNAKALCIYRPDLIAYHKELPTSNPDDAMVKKGRAYGRGLGFVLRKHQYGFPSTTYWTSRSLANTLFALLMFRPDRARYFFWQLIGRLEGAAMRTLNGQY